MFLTIGICLFLSACIAFFGLWGQWRFFEAADETPDRNAAKSIYQAALAALDAQDLDEKDRALAEAELARAFIRQSEEAAPKTRVAAKSFVPILAIGAIAAAIVYLGNGPHLYQDYPYRAQLALWTKTARTEPDRLPPVALAAVFEQDKNAEAKNPTYWLALGTVNMYAGQYYSATKAFQRAQALQGKAFANWSDLGEALTFLSKGAVTQGANDAFEAALKLDANDARAHYYLGKFALNDGHYSKAKSHFMTARAALTPDDHRIKLIDDWLAKVAQAEQGQSEAQARINSMVAGLEARLKTDPDDPEGWARLIRSYRILGQATKAENAVAQMKFHYKNKPELMAQILKASEQAVGSENTEGGALK